jgi:GTPase SAR1 family protein
VTIEQAGLVVVGMGGSGKTTFLRRCYDVLKEDFGNNELNEDIDPKSTAFVVGHIFKDIEVPLFNGTRKELTLCWMDTAGSEDYRLLGQQLTLSVKEQKKKVFLDRPVDYNLLYVWSYEPNYDPVKDVQSFETVLTRFLEEVENLSYFDLEAPNKIYLLLNKSDAAEKAGIAAQFKLDHERCFLRAVEEHGSVPGESLGFLSALSVDKEQIARMMLVSIFGIDRKDWDKAFVGVKMGINQSIVSNLLSLEDARDFKTVVYDAHDGDGQETYFAATIAWIDRYLSTERPPGARALLASLRSFLNEVRKGDEIAQGP